MKLEFRLTKPPIVEIFQKSKRITSLQPPWNVIAIIIACGLPFAIAGPWSIASWPIAAWSIVAWFIVWWSIESWPMAWWFIVSEPIALWSILPWFIWNDSRLRTQKTFQLKMYTCLKSELSYYTWQYWDIQEMMVTIVAWLDLSWTIDKSFIGIALLIEIELDVITLLFGFLKLLFLWRFLFFGSLGLSLKIHLCWNPLWHPKHGVSENNGGKLLVLSVQGTFSWVLWVAKCLCILWRRWNLHPQTTQEYGFTIVLNQKEKCTQTPAYVCTGICLSRWDFAAKVRSHLGQGTI